jgi:heat shock protein HtpX
MAAYGLYTHIASNKFRSMLLLGGLFLLVYVIVFAGALLIEVASNGNGSVAFYLAAGLADVIRTLPYSTAAAAAWIVIAYFFHQTIIDAVTGGESVTRQEQPRLYNLLENLCISRGIPMPRLKIMPSDALNAFATGLNRRQYAVTVTTGLLAALNDQELEAVLGHELTHIRNGDVQMMVVAVIIAGVVGFFGELFFRVFTNFGWNSGGSSWSWPSSRSSSSSSSTSSNSDSKNSGGGAIIVVIIAIVLIMLAWLLSQVVKLALSRSREFLADAGSVELTKDPDAMITALRKIAGHSEIHAPAQVQEMFLDHPRQSGLGGLFATHPPIEARIADLVKYAGGHDPGPLALEAPQQAAQLARPPGEPPSAGNTYGGPWGGDAPQDSGSAAGRPWGSAPGEQSGNPSVPAEPPVGLGSRDDGEGPWGPRR